MALTFFSNRFNFSRPRLTTALIWIGGLAVLTGLTVKDIRPLLGEYYENNLATLVQIIARNETVKPPFLTICIPRAPLTFAQILRHLDGTSNNTFAECYWCERLAENFLDIRTENLLMTNDEALNFASLTITLVQKVLEADSNQNEFEVLNVNRSHWNQPLIDAVWSLFALQVQADKNRGSSSSFHSSTDFLLSKEERIEKLQQRENAYGSLFRSLSDFVLAKKERIEKLYERLISVLCRHLIIGETSGDNLCSNILDKGNHRFNADGFCFDIQLSSVGPIIQVVALGDYGGSYRVMYFLTSTSQWFTVLPDTSFNTWPLPNIRECDLIFTSETENALLIRAEEEVDLRYIVQSAVSGIKEDCYNESTPAECFGNCMVMQIIICYKCVPFTLRKNKAALEFPLLHYCNSTDYERNVRSDFTDYEEVCNQKCSNPCEYIFYQWHTSSILTPLNVVPYRYFTLLIKPVSSPFVQFHMTQKQSWEQFVAGVAGIFGLYLGLSGLTVVALLVQLIHWYKKWSKKRMSVDGTVHLSQTVSPLKNEQDSKKMIDDKLDLLKRELLMEIDSKLGDFLQNL